MTRASVIQLHPTSATDKAYPRGLLRLEVPWRQPLGVARRSNMVHREGARRPEIRAEDRRERTAERREAIMILVMGATGTNGRLVVQALRAAGVPVRAMVQDSSRATDLQRAGAQVIVADFDQPNTLDAALAGAERCLLLSAVDTRLVERETRFVERARKAKLAHLVKFSGIG